MDTAAISSFLKLLLFAQILLLVSSTQHSRYVKPSNSYLSCPYQPCLTLDQYTQQAEKYFTTGAIFQFLAGNHSLQNSVKIENVSEITLKRKDTNNVVIIIFKNELSILCENVTNLNVHSFYIQTTTQTKICQVSAFVTVKKFCSLA